MMRDVRATLDPRMFYRTMSRGSPTTRAINRSPPTFLVLNEDFYPLRQPRPTIYPLVSLIFPDGRYKLPFIPEVIPIKEEVNCGIPGMFRFPILDEILLDFVKIFLSLSMGEK
jgi:hypothetical protein